MYWGWRLDFGRVFHFYICDGWWNCGGCWGGFWYSRRGGFAVEGGFGRGGRGVW